MDAIEIMIMVFYVTFVAFVIGVLVFAIAALLIGGYKQGKLFGLMLAFVSYFGFIGWLVFGGAVLLLGSYDASGYMSIGWRILVYIFVMFGFTALLFEHANIIDWKNNKKK
jgi:MFS family permease